MTEELKRTEGSNTVQEPLGTRRRQDSSATLSALENSNRELAETLAQARELVVTLRADIEELTRPPHGFGHYLAHAGNEDVDIVQAGRKLRVRATESSGVQAAQPGQEVVLNESSVIISVGGFERVGEIVTVKEMLGSDRVLVSGRTDDERVAWLAGPLTISSPRAGDTLIFDARSGFALEQIWRSDVETLLLEETPDVDYEDIGGLGAQIEQIRDAVELPFAHPDLYRDHGLRPPKGVLLYGPPGCGKTLIAKAVAKSLAASALARNESDSARSSRSGEEDEPRSYFLNIKGPELLNKYVGETERQIRLVFARAREKASAGIPVVVFFDEMDSLFRTRGTGVSSDVETTIVPQLLAEIDGVESLDNVIVIGASNREDMIDPAILRPGRLDVKIKIDRPDEYAAREIFGQYLTYDLPLHGDDLAQHGGDRAATVAAMITQVVERMYVKERFNEFLEVSYASGDQEVLYFKDFNSGAMIRNIVDRAKKSAIKDLLSTGVRGVRAKHLLAACAQEFAENEDLPNTSNPDDWARVSGRKGERIVHIRTLTRNQGPATEPELAVDVTVSPDYL